MIVLEHYFLEVFFRNFLTELCHSCFDIIWGDKPVTLSIELFKDGNEAFISYYFLDRHRGSEKLRVIDLVLPVVLDLSNNSLYFFIVMFDFSHL